MRNILRRPTLLLPRGGNFQIVSFITLPVNSKLTLFYLNIYFLCHQWLCIVASSKWTKLIKRSDFSMCTVNCFCASGPFNSRSNRYRVSLLRFESPVVDRTLLSVSTIIGNCLNKSTIGKVLRRPIPLQSVSFSLFLMSIKISSNENEFPFKQMDRLSLTNRMRSNVRQSFSFRLAFRCGHLKATAKIVMNYRWKFILKKDIIFVSLSVRFRCVFRKYREAKMKWWQIVNFSTTQTHFISVVSVFHFLFSWPKWNRRKTRFAFSVLRLRALFHSAHLAIFCPADAKCVIFKMSVCE